MSHDIPTIEHTGFLEDLTEVPTFLVPKHEAGRPLDHRYSCSYCGVGDGTEITPNASASSAPTNQLPDGTGTFTIELPSGPVEYPAELSNGGLALAVQVSGKPELSDMLVSGRLAIGEQSKDVVARADRNGDSTEGISNFKLSAPVVKKSVVQFKQGRPTAGCLKMKTSTGIQRTTFPAHQQPSILDAETGERTAISYQHAINQLADLLLAHRPPKGRSLIYACGQIDYFTIFSFQEVFRILGVRSLAGNAEHCLNAGAVHNEILTGQEGPFLTVDQAIHGDNRFFLLNGWNGLISHPPVFGEMMKHPNFDGFMVEVAETESVRAFVRRFGEERVLFVKSGTDPHLALAVAHEILDKHPQAVEQRFIDQYADPDAWQEYRQLASSDQFDPQTVAERIAPEPEYVDRLVAGISTIAAKIAEPATVPINLPSVGLSQTKGAVAHCLWGSTMAMVGKYGLNADGTVAGGALRVPGQINAQSEVQGLSRGFFMGRIKMTEEGIPDAARRMGLPDDAYEVALNDAPRTALDYSDPTPDDEPEVFICFGTQFESNMLGRKRWIEKLKAGNTKLVVVDPIPDPFTIEHADLIIPSPPHAAAAKLYQNGEWRLTLSIPRKQRPKETRTDATIVYDAMAEVSKRLHEDDELKAANPDLARHVDSGYLRQRFESPDVGGGLSRIDGEVSRPELWDRVQEYMTGPENSLGPLYCRPEHESGELITWSELVENGDIIYGGVGTSRYQLKYDDSEHIPFRDIWRRPGKFRFFVPTEQDLSIIDGIKLNSGRSTMTDDKKRIRFAVSTFNSGKATAAVDLPDSNACFVSLMLAEEFGIQEGDQIRITGVESGGSLVLDAVPTDRVKGEAIYISFHKTKAEIEEGIYINDLTSHVGRCPYTHQSNFKLTVVNIERVAE
ncbi:MAG: hypothetical protein CMJ78_24230 [Planctomycetaceae bacterium]|nr:hypothetical protein [Planctomycetaceae bacterium]